MARRTVNLNGDDWRLGQAPSGVGPGCAAWDELDRVGEWLPATVPGNVRADLVRDGRLPDLTFGTQAELSRWVDDEHWWLVREFSLPLSPSERVRLVLRGVDYLSDLYFNGQYLGRHEGMFSPQVHEVTELVGVENRLAVRIVGSSWLPRDRSSPWLKLLNQAEVWASSLSDRFPHRRDLLKCQMGFGWDFAPPLPTMGVWDDVYAIVSGQNFIRDVVVREWAVGEGIALAIDVMLDAGRAGPAQLRTTLAGETFEVEPLVVEQSVELRAGASRCTISLPIPQPRLWWPWDHGRPDLYCLTVDLADGEQPLDSVTQTLGLRQVELRDWTLHINERPVYARGANWVPADILPGCVAEADYRALLDLARRANMNMLRVWGGGLREKRAFYDLCDRLGILVWQELPFACAFLTRYPRSPDYLRLVDAETRAIVRDVRSHPCLVLWCGGNEFSPQRNEPLIAALERAVKDEDPTRPFLPASPDNGDSHNWQVWHHFEPPSTYRRDRASFASEFGLQALPGVESLRRFIPTLDLWPPGPSWEYHGAGLAKLQRYARPFLRGEENSLESFVLASQQAQAHGLQVGIEHYRRRKALGHGGVLLWQLNEPWPAISWALIDFFRQPKLAYELVKRLLNPTLVSVDYALREYKAGDSLQADVWVINDKAEALPDCHLEVALLDGSGQVVEQLEQTLCVAATSAEVVGRLGWTLPEGDAWRLECRLSRGSQILVENEYDLTAYDGIRPALSQRLWKWLADWVVPT